MERIFYATEINKGDEVLVRLPHSNSFSKYYVDEARDQFVGIKTMQYSSSVYYYIIADIEIYKYAE